MVVEVGVEFDVLHVVRVVVDLEREDVDDGAAIVCRAGSGFFSGLEAVDLDVSLDALVDLLVVDGM